MRESVSVFQALLLRITFFSITRVLANNGHSVCCQFHNGSGIRSHIYAASTQDGIPAVDINLAEGANLAIAGGNRPAPAAYANIDNPNNAAIAISTATINKVDLKVSSFLFSASKSNSADIATSAKSIIRFLVGNAVAGATVNNLKTTLASSNTLTSFAVFPSIILIPQALS
jgi:hypothetical protein